MDRPLEYVAVSFVKEISNSIDRALVNALELLKNNDSVIENHAEKDFSFSEETPDLV